MSKVPYLAQTIPLSEESAASVGRTLGLDTVVATSDIPDPFRQIVETARQAILVRDGDRLLYCNQSHARMLGFDGVEALLTAGKSFVDYIHPDDRHRPVAVQSGRNEITARSKFRLIRRDGTVIWVDCQASRLSWNGMPATLVSMTEIVLRRRADNSQLKSERLYEKIFEASPDILSLSTVEHGRLVAVNDAFLKLYGSQRSEVIGRNEAELGLWNDLESRQRLLRIIERRGAVRNIEIAVSRGETARRLGLSVELLEVDGQRLLLMAARDMTERHRQAEEVRRSKEAAEMANRSKSEFLANMSHELRTPLSAIMGFSEMIRDQMLGPIGTEKYVEYAEDIHRSSEHLKQIINDLLDLSKIEAGKMALRETAVSLPALISDCVRLVRGRAASARVRLRVETRDSVPELRGDQRLLKQIMLNLMANAVTFTPQRGTVTVGARNGEGDCVEMFVADTGVGMTENEITVALTRFGQVDGMLASQHHGTGLGLPLARSLAELHGGQLAIRSAPGQGTTVTVTLPADRVLGIRTA